MLPSALSGDIIYIIIAGIGDNVTAGGEIFVNSCHSEPVRTLAWESPGFSHRAVRLQVSVLDHRPQSYGLRGCSLHTLMEPCPHPQRYCDHCSITVHSPTDCARRSRDFPTGQENEILAHARAISASQMKSQPAVSMKSNPPIRRRGGFHPRRGFHHKSDFSHPQGGFN